MTSPLLTPEEQAEAIVNACRLPLNIHAPDVYCHAQLVKVVKDIRVNGCETQDGRLWLPKEYWNALKELAQD